MLAPIAGDLPQGADPREDDSSQSPYRRLKDARSEARDAEKQAETPDPEAPAPVDPGPMWRTLRDLGRQLLTETTKDLEIAAWVTEGYLRSHGLAGLAAGCQLITGLVQEYWDGLYPLPDEYGMETRVAPIAGLNGRSSLIGPLSRMVLFRRSDGSDVEYYQYQASAALVSLDATRRQQRIDAGVVPFDEMERDARTVGLRALTKLRDDAKGALAAWEAMSAIIDEKAADELPGTGDVRDLLQSIATIARRYAPEEETPAEAVAAAVEEGGEAAAGGTVPGERIGVGRQIASREDALKMLTTLASFFRQTEPTSPLSYTLDEAVRRARMPWPELLEEVVSDTDTRNAILTSLGIRPPPPPE